MVRERFTFGNGAPSKCTADDLVKFNANNSSLLPIFV